MVPAAQKPSRAPASVPGALRNLLTGLIDYAGMFPPAKLSIESAARNYIRYARGPHAWMLGKFIVPAEQLEDLRDLLSRDTAAQGLTVSLSVLLGTEPLRDAKMIQEAVVRASGGSHPVFSIDALEFRPGAPSIIPEMASALPQGIPIFCEVPNSERLMEWLTAIHRSGCFAKIRTGGTTPESFPSSAKVAEFLAECNVQGVAFKATAGLHHPVRSKHPLTYDQDSLRGVMHGFLNVFLGATLLKCGAPNEQVIAVLDDTKATNFRFSDDFAHWDKLFLNRRDIAGARQQFAISFGSCSFEEPIEDLQKLSLL
jgi:hypothetical protein